MKIRTLASIAIVACLSLSVSSYSTPSRAAGAYVDTDPVPAPSNKNYKEGASCAGAKYGWAVIGRLKNGNPGYIACENGQFVRPSEVPSISAKSRKPLIPIAVPAQSTFAYAPFSYITPGPIKGKPTKQISKVSNFSDLSTCRIAEAETSSRPHMATGFPIPAERAVMDSQVIVQVVPSDFIDARSSSNPAKDIADATKAVSDFYSRMSNGKTKIIWRIPTKYFSLDSKTSDYKLGDFRGDISGYFRYAKDAIAKSDESINFSGADVVAFVAPPTITDQQIGGFIAEAATANGSGAVVTNEKTIYNNYIVGGDQVRDIFNWIHEFGHMLGMTDNGGQSGGSAMGFDIMLWYGVPELSIWNRFLLGISEPGNINCVTNSEPTTHWLRPVESKSKETKGVVIPLTETKALVVESRRRLGYDTLIGQESQGALVYLIDTSKSGSEGSASFKAVGPARMSLIAQWSLDSPLKKGESVTAEGWTVSVIESGSFGDVVKVEKR